MTGGGLETMVGHLHAVIGAQSARGSSDAELLARFATRRDEAAFGALVQRHGRLVLRVCRQVLSHEQDAEDAFQATFLVLGCKAGSIRKRDSLASWLYGVAYRIAMKAKTNKARRLRATRRSPDCAGGVGRGSPGRGRNEETPATEAALRELQAMLAQEVERLPDKFRAPFVLCCLEGKSQAETAAELGWKQGTVSGRLAQARRRLQARLSRRGVTLSAGLCAAALSAPALSASLVAASVRNSLSFASGRAVDAVAPAAALARSVLRGAAITKLTLTLVLGFTLATAIAAGLLARPIDAVAPPPVPVAADDDAPAKVPDKPAAKDMFGDALPEGAVARLGTVRFRHHGQVNAAALSPGGKTVASASDDGTVRIWDAANGQELLRLRGHRGSVRSVQFSPDGKTLASGAWEGDASICLWDAATGQLKHRLHDGSNLFGRLDFSPAGTLLASGSYNHRVHVWEVETGKLRHLFKGEDKGAFAVPVVFSPNGERLASAGNDGIIRLWDIAAQSEIRQFAAAKANKQQPNDDLVWALAFSPDGKALASTTRREAINLWDVATGKEIRQFTGHEWGCQSLRFLRDGGTLAGADHLGGVWQWDISTGKLLQRFTVSHRINSGPTTSIHFSRDGKTLAALNDSTMQLWDLATGDPLNPQLAQAGALRRVLLSPNGRVLASAEQHGDRAIRLWDVATAKEIGSAFGQAGEFPVAFAPSGKSLISGGSWFRKDPVHLWDLATRKQVQEFPPPKGKILKLDFGADQPTVVHADEEAIRISDLSSGKELRKLGAAPPGDFSHGLTLCPDGKTVLWFKAHEALHLRDLATDKDQWTVPIQSNILYSTCFSANGKILALAEGQKLQISSADPERAVRILELASGRQLLRFGPCQDGYASVSFSADGRTLATGGHEHGIRLWELSTGALRLRLAGPPGAVSGLVFAKRGKQLISVNSDATALIWDLTGQVTRSKLPAQKNAEPGLDQCWNDLGNLDAVTAYRVLWRFAEAGPHVVPFLRARLRPVAAADPKRLAALIKDLGSEQFAARDQAARELAQLGDAAESALRAAAAADPPLEVKRRIEQLLQALSPPISSPERLRAVRAIEALEYQATPAARQLLDELAQGLPGALVTREARATLQRLAVRGTQE